MDFGDFFSFDKKLAPHLVKPIYWIGSMLIAPIQGIGYMIWAVFFVITSVLALRVATEMTLALFEIHDKVGAGPAAATPTTSIRYFGSTSCCTKISVEAGLCSPRWRTRAERTSATDCPITT